MIVSNEPGYYKTGEYGIRIENLQYVSEDIEPPKGAERDMLGFETLTLAPLHHSLIDISILTPAEISYVDSYHSRVWREISPLIEGEAKVWLEHACKPLGA